MHDNEHGISMKYGYVHGEKSIIIDPHFVPFNEFSLHRYFTHRCDSGGGHSVKIQYIIILHYARP